MDELIQIPISQMKHSSLLQLLSFHFIFSSGTSSRQSSAPFRLFGSPLRQLVYNILHWLPRPVIQTNSFEHFFAEEWNEIQEPLNKVVINLANSKLARCLDNVFDTSDGLSYLHESLWVIFASYHSKVGPKLVARVVRVYPVC